VPIAYRRAVRRFLNRLSRPVALLVIAAQLLLGFSVMATAQVPATAGTHAPCEAMPTVEHDDGCPCCPDDAGSMKGCLTMCSLAAAIAPSEIVVAVTPSRAAPFIEFAGYHTSLADPPLKPPPIA
jgi:hypothetical protein